MPWRRWRPHVLSGLQWAAGWWLLARLQAPRPPGTWADGGHRRSVSVLVPARDEQGALPHLLASLAQQSRPPDEIIVVDDDSQDRTAAIAAAAGATVIASSGPPPGWSGKCWALHQAQAVAQGAVLVFIDADVTLAPDGLARMVGELERLGGQGLVSAEPYHRPRRRYEQLSGVCNIVAVMGTGAFSGPPRRDAAMAFGPCAVIDRATYDLTGGHQHPDIRARITEDLALARRTRCVGRPVGIFAGGDVVAFRMYPDGIGQLLDGWTKVLATGAAGAPGGVSALVAFWVTGALMAARAGWRAGTGAGSAGRSAADVATYAAWAAQMRWMLRRVGEFGPLTAAAFPVPLGVFVGCSARSALKIAFGRPLAWRGRSLTGR